MIHGFARALLGFSLLFLFLIPGCSKTFVYPEDERSQAEPVRSADWIAALPEGEIRRQVVLGCTPCHQIGPPVAYRKTLEEWREVIFLRMADRAPALAESGVEARRVLPEVEVAPDEGERGESAVHPVGV